MVSFKKFSREGSSRNAVEEPTGRDDKVTFSQKGSSRNAVEEYPGRVNLRQVTGWSSLRDEKSIVYHKVSRSKLSCNARKRSPDRDTSLGCKRSSRKDEKFISRRPTPNRGGLWFVFKPKGFRPHAIAMLLILILQCGAGATDFMTREQANNLTTYINSNLRVFKRFCGSKSNQRRGRQTFPGLEHTPNQNIGGIAGNYKNRDYRACVQYKAFEKDGQTYHRYNFNYVRYKFEKPKPNQYPPYKGHSAVIGDDAQLYLYRHGGKAHNLLIVRQRSEYFVVIPFTDDDKTHLWIFDTGFGTGWAYEPCDENIQADELLKLLHTDMEKAWQMWSPAPQPLQRVPQKHRPHPSPTNRQQVSPGDYDRVQTNPAYGGETPTRRGHHAQRYGGAVYQQPTQHEIAHLKQRRSTDPGTTWNDRVRGRDFNTTGSESSHSKCYQRDDAVGRFSRAQKPVSHPETHRSNVPHSEWPTGRSMFHSNVHGREDAVGDPSTHGLMDGLRLDFVTGVAGTGVVSRNVGQDDIASQVRSHGRKPTNRARPWQPITGPPGFPQKPQQRPRRTEAEAVAESRKRNQENTGWVHMDCPQSKYFLKALDIEEFFVLPGGSTKQTEILLNDAKEYADALETGQTDNVRYCKRVSLNKWNTKCSCGKSRPKNEFYKTNHPIDYEQHSQRYQVSWVDGTTSI